MLVLSLIPTDEGEGVAYGDVFRKGGGWKLSPPRNQKENLYVSMRGRKRKVSSVWTLVESGLEVSALVFMELYYSYCIKNTDERYQTTCRPH